MSESDARKMLTIPKWDGRVETCPRYLSTIGALTEYHNCGDAMDETDMATCLMKMQYLASSDNTILPTL